LILRRGGLGPPLLSFREYIIVLYKGGNNERID
jgi:hypothetical protein